MPGCFSPLHRLACILLTMMSIANLVMMNTPVAHLTSPASLDFAILLIKHGTDSAAQNKDRMTFLHQASKWGHVDLAQLLIEHGTNTAGQIKDGTTLLHQVSKLGHVDLVQLLIEHSTDTAALVFFSPVQSSLFSIFGMDLDLDQSRQNQNMIDLRLDCKRPVHISLYAV